MSTLENSEDPDEMQHNAAFHQGLYCLPRLKQPLTEIYNNLENATCDHLKYKMGDPMLIVSISGIFLPFWSQGQGPVEFGKISFEPSEFGNLMQSKRSGLPFLMD